ncbi:MAG: tetratricopeptide repeat protein [Candidatus Rokubacteria bacterium]|nr:tetratricopeptide repeat protein [Candidatus Rokubacteria bacterium]
MTHDRYGLALGTTSAPARDAYVDAVDRLLSAAPGPIDAFDAAVAADPGFALGHAGRARALQARARIPEAKAAAADARTLAAGGERRQRQHVEAIALGIEGQAALALELALAHLREFPADALVLSLLTGVYSLVGFSGRADRNEFMRDLLDRLAPAYGDDWWFLGMHGFAHTEAGRPDVGGRLLERSFALQPANANAVHSLAHVYYEMGDAAGGASFVESWLPGYDRAGQLHCHISWHLALFELAEGHEARALEIYRDAIRPGASRAVAVTTVTDASSLLWRLKLAGRAAPGWEDVSALAREAFPRMGVTFADAHCALAFAAAGDTGALEGRIAELEAALAAGRLAAGPVAVALARAIAAFARGQWEEVIARLEPWAHELVRVGGSAAQRDVFEDTLLGAYLRAGRKERAEAVLRDRLARRPAVRPVTVAAG